MGKFNFIETKIKDLFIIEPTVFGDERGYFFESYNKEDFFRAGLSMEFMQDNESMSVNGVLRGLHFQIKKPQGKLVRVIKGEVFDVAVDLRKDSKTYGMWEGIYLSDENKKQFYVPEGFAHGFLVTSDVAQFAYKCTNLYDQADESGVIWNDKTIDIKWPLDKIKELKLSEKDTRLKGI